jgi:hypothetical protein
MDWVTWALVILCVFLVIEGGRRALALSFKWIDTVEGLLLIAAGILGAVGLIAHK